MHEYSFYFPFTNSEQWTVKASQPARVCVWNCSSAAVKEKKWIGPSAFQQQQGVSGTVSTAQTWLARWLDDKL